MDQQLGNVDEMNASQLPLANEDDFIKLIYTRLYGQRKNMGYTIETMEEREVNGYRFKDFRIRRRENGISGGLLQKRRIISAESANCLLGTCFLCKGNQNTRPDYYFVLKYRKEFKEYLGVLGYRLEINEEYGVVQLTSPGNQPHESEALRFHCAFDSSDPL